MILYRQGKGKCESDGQLKTPLAMMGTTKSLNPISQKVKVQTNGNVSLNPKRSIYYEREVTKMLEPNNFIG